MEPDDLINQIEQTVAPFTSYFRQLYDQDEFNTEFNELWTIKDILGHVLWYEEEMIKMISTRSIKSASDIWDNELHQRNKLIYKEMNNISGQELLERHDIAVKEICTSVEDMTEEYLTDPKFFDGMPEEWTPWKIIAGSTFYHYTDHLRRLQEFME